jgi:hypothetical protein
MSTRSRLLAALILPYLIVVALGYSSWKGRLVSVGYLWALLGFLAVRFATLPSKQLISPEAKLRQMSDKVIATVVLCIRAAAIAMAVYLGFTLIIYLQDVYDIVATRHVKTIPGHVTAIQYGALTWWCLKDVWVQTDGSLQGYSLLFYPTSIQADSDYEMHVLPRSTTILSLERCLSR